MQHNTSTCNCTQPPKAKGMQSSPGSRPLETGAPSPTIACSPTELKHSALPPSELALHDNNNAGTEETGSLSISTITHEDAGDLLNFLQDLRIKPDVARSYRRKLLEGGYDDLEALDEADEAELLHLGLKVGHVKRIKRATPTNCLPPQPSRSDSNRYFFGDSFVSETGGINSSFASSHYGHHPPPPGTPPHSTLNNMDSSLQLSASVHSMAIANEKIMQQAERIRQLECELSTAVVPLSAQPPMSGQQQQEQSVTSLTAKTSPSPESRRVLTAEERLQAHKERKQQENRYKDLAGKWEAPTPMKKEKVDLTKKVSRNDDMVERLAASAQERRRHSEIQQNVADVLQRYATADDEDDEDSTERKGGQSVTFSNHYRPRSRDAVSSRSKTPGDKQSALMQRLGMTPNTRRKMHAEQEATRSEKRTLRGHRMAKPQWRMSNEFQPADGHEEEEEDSIDLGYISDVSPDRCHTCNALDDLEEDLDDPGLFYCSRCWNEYESSATLTPGPRDLAGLSQHQSPLKQMRAPPQSALTDHDQYQEQALASVEPPRPTAPRNDRALWIVHDNPQLGSQVMVSGSKRMKCMVETKEPNKKNCVRILTGVIDYSGSVSRCDLDRSEHPDTEAGTECLRLRNVRGYIVDHTNIESRLSSNKSIYEFHLDGNDATMLTGKDATMTAKVFLEGCQGSVDVIIDPQCSPGEWYPQREASGDNARKLAPQFRSKGVGYIRLGDDMSRNGQAFLSSDACRTFFPGSSGEGSNSSLAIASSKSKMKDLDTSMNISTVSRPTNEGVTRTTTAHPNKSHNANVGRARSRQLQGLSIDFSDDEEGGGTESVVESDSDNIDDDSMSFAESDCTPVDDAGDILKQLQSVEITKEMKWSEKADLVVRLGKVLAEEDSPRGQCSAALKVIQDVLGGKNVNVHVLRASVEAAGNIGERLGRELVSEVSWRPIMLNMLRLLSSKQGSAVAKRNLERLHGLGYSLTNSLVCISHALGLGKETGGGRRNKAAASRAANALKTANNVDVVEWLAQRVEAERHMQDLEPKADKGTLETLARFFLSHVGHRDPRCRKNLIEGLISTVLCGVGIGQKMSEALSMVSELKLNNPRGWKQISARVEKEIKSSPKKKRK